MRSLVDDYDKVRMYCAAHVASIPRRHKTSGRLS